jgi:hypothetical protein
MSELNPCANPTCREQAEVEYAVNGKVFVQCPYCGLRGPSAEVEDEAKELWNALPRRLPAEPPQGMVRCTHVVWINSENEVTPSVISTDGWQPRRIVADVKAWQEPEVPQVQGECNE